jgi:hypothetical protein
MKMAFYSQLVALGLQVSFNFNDTQIVLGDVNPARSRLACRAGEHARSAGG